MKYLLPALALTACSIGSGTESPTTAEESTDCDDATDSGVGGDAEDSGNADDSDDTGDSDTGDTGDMGDTGDTGDAPAPVDGISVALVPGWNTVGLPLVNPNGSGQWTGREILDAVVDNDTTETCTMVWFGTDYNDEGWYHLGQEDNTRSVPEGGGAYIYCNGTGTFTLDGDEFDEEAFLDSVHTTDFERWTMVSFGSDSALTSYDMCAMDTVDPVGAVAVLDTTEDRYRVHPCAWSTSVTETHITINGSADYVIDTTIEAQFGQSYVLWFDEAEQCEDGIDNDGDGQVDEGCYQEE